MHKNVRLLEHMTMRFILAFLALLIFANFAAAASVEDDTQRYIQIFSGEKKLHSDAADTFSWMGLSDTRLFDIGKTHPRECIGSVRVKLFLATEYLDITLRIVFNRSGSGKIGENQQCKKCKDKPHCHLLP